MLGFNIQQFQQLIWNFYRENKREFPWRETPDPYEILVSELMLQQTQTYRVLPKYNSFLERFPTVFDLADATLEEVLREWSGLGYNRRAVYLKKTAEVLIAQNNGKIPKSIDELVKLPGIGVNTAGAIIAFAFNKPVVFIETNIRRVYIHHFFQDQVGVSDKQILELVRKTLPKGDFRDWYYALMDYGVELAKTVENPNKKSKHYSVQSKFEGSRRKLRGHILRVLLEKQKAGLDDLVFESYDEKFLQDTIYGMVKEGIIKEEDKTFTIA